jgi:choline dehydrogenase-like flavoprotein
LRFHFRWSQNEIRQVNHMHDTFAALIETMGGKVTGPKRPAHDTDWISVPGTIIHESGTVRMGDDPKKSALNKYCQAHDVKNLFVTDAAPFVSQPDKNVTLSIVAFSWRASEYLAGEMRKGNV